MTPADSPPARFILRDLPGVADIERCLANPNRHWAKENDDLPKRIEQVSIALFGITEDDTEFQFSEAYMRKHEPWSFPDYDPVKAFWERAGEDSGDDEDEDDPEEIAQDDWELNFDVLMLPFDQQRILFDAIGWDVTDETAERLWCLEAFGRQIIAVTKGLKGHLPGADAASALEKAKVEASAGADLASWESNLAREALRFRSVAGK